MNYYIQFAALTNICSRARSVVFVHRHIQTIHNHFLCPDDMLCIRFKPTYHDAPQLSYTLLPIDRFPNHALTAPQCHEQEPEQLPSPPREPHPNPLQGSSQNAPQMPHHCNSFRRTLSAKTRQLLRLSAEERLFWVSTSPPTPLSFKLGGTTSLTHCQAARMI
jgi:hypothetical protein